MSRRSPLTILRVSVLHSGFNTLTRDDVRVPANDAVTLEMELTPAGSELPEYVVLVPHISGSLASVLEERREDTAVANILGSEQISKAGDSDAAGALKRVTGLTLVGGRFIFVRGLGERYSSTLLNNANVPSPNPTRRVVPLDLFPAGIIDRHDTEPARLVQSDFHAGHCRCGVIVGMELQHGGVIHAIDVVAREDNDKFGATFLQQVEVLVDRICRSRVPGLAGTHLRRNRGDVFIQLGVEDGPAITQVFL